MRFPVEGYGEPVPGGASQAPVSGSQVREHARGCAAQIGGSVRKPPYTGPDGVTITYGGAGAGVGSAPAVTAACAHGSDDPGINLADVIPDL